MNTYRVLIVDDDLTSHEVLGEYLRAAGYEVLGATNGQEGLDMAQKAEPDLVLLDVQMPVLDGFQTLTRLKASALADVPVLLLTQLDRSYLKVKGLEAGADDYITKPFDKSELLARIKAALRRSARYRRTAAVLEGRLAEIGLTDVLQALDLGGRTATVRLRELDAEVVVRAGLLVRVRFRTFEGLPALERLLLAERGDFAVSLDAGEPSEETLGPVTTLLMKGLTEVDEVRRELERALRGCARLGRGEAAAADAALAPLLDLLPLPARELVGLLPGKLKENVEVLRRAVEAGTLIGLG